MLKIIESFTTDHPEPVDCDVKGTVPTWISGSLLRTGPGLFRFGPDEGKHLFDGMAVLHRYSLQDGKVTYRNRLLDSDTYRRNKAANRIVVSEFGTVGVPDPCKSIFTRYFSYFYDTAEMTDNNCVNLMQLGDQVYAMTETQVMNRVDPQTLHRIGQANWQKHVAVHMATAHPLKEQDGTTYNLGTTLGAQSYYHFIKIPPAVPGDPNPLDKASLIGRIPSQWPRMPNYSHSFGMTDNYMIFIEQPAGFNFLKVIGSRLTGKGLGDAMAFYDGYDVKIHIMNKFSGALVRTEYITKSFFVFHHINAYEDQQHLVVDLAAHASGEVVQALMLETLRNGDDQHVNSAILKRFVLPLNVNKGATGNLVTLKDTTATATLTGTNSVYCTPEVIQDAYIELPRINEKYLGKDYRFAYGVSNKSGKGQDGMLIKVDVKTKKLAFWSEEGHIAGEPVFLATPGGKEEDDGVLLSPVISFTDGKPSFLLIMDAKSFAELARAHIPEDVSVPLSFHGIFSE